MISTPKATPPRVSLSARVVALPPLEYANARRAIVAALGPDALPGELDNALDSRLSDLSDLLDLPALMSTISTKQHTPQSKEYIMATITTRDEAWDYLVECAGVSEETLRIISSINGHSVETYESVLFAVTGYRSFDQLEEMDA